MALVEFSKDGRRVWSQSRPLKSRRRFGIHAGDDAPRNAKLFLESLDARRADRDRSAVNVAASPEGVASLRALAALDRSARSANAGAKDCAKAARRWPPAARHHHFKASSTDLPREQRPASMIAPPKGRVDARREEVSHPFEGYV